MPRLCGTQKHRSNAVGTNQSAGLTEHAKEYFRVNIAIPFIEDVGELKASYNLSCLHTLSYLSVPMLYH